MTDVATMKPVSSSDSLIIGCVTENLPKYLAQSLRLLQSVRWFGGSIANARFIVCSVEAIDPEWQATFESYQGEVRVVPRYSTKHPQSNKLRFLELDIVQDYDHVVLLDCDTIVVQDPADFFLGDRFQAKIADAGTIPMALFEKLFQAFDLPLPKADFKCTVTGEKTIPYFNAGVLLFTRGDMRELLPVWLDQNRKLIDRFELLEEHSNYCEQAALSLAIGATGCSFGLLGNEMNFPTHFGKSFRSLDVDPLIIHYHSDSDQSGYIKPCGYPLVDARIKMFNDRLRKERQESFDNRLFWNARYQENPELGSGLGSRGEWLEYKQQLLVEKLKEQEIKTILDVGCGDMETGSALPVRGYTGLDISETIIGRNRKTYPDRSFLCGDFTEIELPAKADMVICLDVLIHLNDPILYRRFVDKLVKSAAKTGIVAGYVKDPNASGIIFFHEPLDATLKSCGACNIREVGAYRNVTVLQFDSPSASDSTEKPDTENHELTKPVFVVAPMRSGTTLFADLLGAYQGIAHCPFELKDVWSKDGQVPMASAKTRDTTCRELGKDDVQEGQAERLKAAFLARMEKTYGKVDPDAYFLNKNPHLCNKLPFVEALFPDARFIWIFRDLPFVVSSLKELFRDVHRRQKTWHYWPEPNPEAKARCWQAFHQDEKPDHVDSNRLFPGGDIRFLAEYWMESNLAVKEFFAAGSPEKCTRVDYDFLVKETDKVIKDCLNFIGLNSSSQKTVPPTIEEQRNFLWRERLNETEMSTLIAFIRDNEATINIIGDGKDLAGEYLETMDKKQQSGFLRKILFRR